MVINKTMKKLTGQIFLFLIPTLMVALVFIAFSQQNVITDDSDSNSLILTIDAPVKHLSHSIFAPAFYFTVPTGNESLPALTVIGIVFVFSVLINRDKSLCEIRNHSPPLRQGFAGQAPKILI